MKKLNITTMNNRVIVEPVIKEKVSDNGIIIMGDNKSDHIVGTVLAIGYETTPNGKVLVTNSINLGDKILFSKNSATELHIENIDCYVVKNDDVLAIVES